MILALAAASLAAGAERNVVLIAGTPSHGPLAHEHNAGVRLLANCLGSVPGIRPSFRLNGWPSDTAALDAADAILIYSDGSERHPAFAGDHAGILDRAAKRGAGLVFLHYAVEPPATRGQQEMLFWIGGAFELHYSVNPTWEADFRDLPRHPVTRGVEPFRLRDEWYYHLRFVEGMRGITPILTAVPPASTLDRPDGPRSGNPHVRAAAGKPQVLAWAYERPGGGRGFGFTGGHFHHNWGNENFRKVVLNAVVWAARGEVPPEGVSVPIHPDELNENLDPKPGKP